MQRSSETHRVDRRGARQGASRTDQSGEGAGCDHSRSNPRDQDQTFRYAALSSGLTARKALGGHEIATVQATAIDREAGLIL